MLLRNRYLLQFTKSTRTILVCGFIAGMACVAGAQNAARLVVVNAVYGDLSNPAATTNVTKIVAAMVTDDTLDFHPNNDMFGGDPATGVLKELKVDYTIDGVDGTKSAYEGGRFKLSANPSPPKQKSRLVIVKAIYGNLSNGKVSDVTADVADMVENDGLEVVAMNGNFGDPALGTAKELRVDYTFSGWKKTVTVQENETLKISPGAETADNQKRILFFCLWIVSGIMAVSVVVAVTWLLARKLKN